MSQKDIASRIYYASCCFVLFFMAAAASFNGFYSEFHFREAGLEFGSMPRASLEAMLDGTANRPFVYRQLLPMLANWIDARVPEQTKDHIFEARIHSGKLIRERLFHSPLAQNRAYFLRYWIVYAADFLLAWISVFAMYLICRSVGHAPPIAALSAIILILLIPYFMTLGGYFYDYPELAFFALAVWMALNFDWWWMIPIVALGALNKESFLFFIPALYPLLRQRASRINAMVGTGVLGLICAAVYCALRVRFQLNPGETAEIHLLEQIQFMLHLHNWFYPQQTYGILVLPIYNPLSLALIAWTLWRGWRSLPRAIQRHMQIAAIINFPLYFLFCYPGEFRNLSLLYVTLLLLLAANLTEWTSGQTKTST